MYLLLREREREEEEERKRSIGYTRIYKMFFFLPLSVLHIITFGTEFCSSIFVLLVCFYHSYFCSQFRVYIVFV